MHRPLRTSTALSVAVTAALMAGVVVLHPSPEMAAVRRLVGVGDERVLAIPAIGSSDGVFAFSATQLGSTEPVGWNPCHPVAYAVNPAGMPDGARDLVDRAITRISEATGLEFEDAGDTDRRPFTGALVPLGAAQPLVIAWGDSSEFPRLADDVAGLGGAASEQGVTGRRYYVTGGIALDTDTFTDKSVALGTQQMEAIVLHELGHVVGLDHVDDPGELMADENSGRLDLGPGDREGLALLGAVPCG